MNLPTSANNSHNTFKNQFGNVTDDGFQRIEKGVAAFVGEGFFRLLVKSLCDELDVRYAFVTELLETGTRVRTLAFWGGDTFLENIEFDLAGTPCEEVINGQFTFYPESVQTHFPEHKALSEMDIESFLGVPLLDPQGICLGHLAVFHTQPFAIDPQIVSDLQRFCARASVELVRQRIEKQLRVSEGRLANVLESTMDAIITIDKDRHVTLFNAAAEEMFLCRQEQIIGRCLDEFLCDPFMHFVSAYFDNDEHSTNMKAPLWAPSGLMARRSNGQEFLVETTLSPLATEGCQFLTFILRDIDKRQQAESAIEALQSQNRYLKEEIRSAHNAKEIIGKSNVLATFLTRLEQVAPVDTTVLISGETGTGKELIARALHTLSLRNDKLLVKVNCVALPPELLESELFGHEKGAFTGALQQRKGRFELAHEGTLFLDEIGELSLDAQAKLLRVLQEQEFERVGGTATIRINVRIVAATNRNLAELVAQGRFREDLFYRLNVIPLYVPALRERRVDIPLLVDHFLGKYRRSTGKVIRGISDQSMAKLQSYNWPGNIRELQNIIERAVVLTQTEWVEIQDCLENPAQPEDHPSCFSTQVDRNGFASASKTILTEDDRKEFDRANIIAALKKTHGKVYGPDGAADKLGMKPTTLASRIKSLGIRKVGFAPCYNFGN